MRQIYYAVIIDFPSDPRVDVSIIDQMAISDYECSGVMEFSIAEEKVDEILGQRAYSGGDIPVEVINEVDQKVAPSSFQYFFTEEQKESCLAFIDDITENFSTLKVRLEERPVEDWNVEWRKHYKPLIISDDLQIIPEWYRDKQVYSKAISVFIYPGTGFGTGNHETTYLCLKLLADIPFKKNSDSCRCLDFGCGSGILGIAAIKLLKCEVDFCDIDCSALDNCRQNVEINVEEEELGAHRLVSRARFIPNKTYSLVFANILEVVLIQEISTIVGAVAPEGNLIVSGLLNDQVDSIIAKYSGSNGLSVVKTISKGDWGAILFRRES